jgi:hypothetical protein
LVLLLCGDCLLTSPARRGTTHPVIPSKADGPGFRPRREEPAVAFVFRLAPCGQPPTALIFIRLRHAHVHSFAAIRAIIQPVDAEAHIVLRMAEAAVLLARALRFGLVALPAKSLLLHAGAPRPSFVPTYPRPCCRARLAPRTGSSSTTLAVLVPAYHVQPPRSYAKTRSFRCLFCARCPGNARKYSAGSARYVCA